MDTPVIDLIDYPVPDGIPVPRLMPYQLRAFNGDGHLADEVLTLRDKHGLNIAIETGTCLGSTTIWLAQNFNAVLSTEVSAVFADIALKRIRAMGIGNVAVRSNKNPALLLSDLALQVNDSTLCFLDAHPMSGKGDEGYATVLLELRTIAQARAKPVIIVHDMLIPGLPEAGWDSYNGRPFTLEWLAKDLDSIYGEGGWGHRYPTAVAGANRGWVSIFPVVAAGTQDASEP